MYWAYKCKLGFAQGTCKCYRPDKTARGYNKFSGCPSCEFREPASPETQRADDYWYGEVINGKEEIEKEK